MADYDYENDENFNSYVCLSCGGDLIFKVDEQAFYCITEGIMFLVSEIVIP
jgi:hypothetical protein